MTRPDYLKDCTEECERRVRCLVCGRTKKPWGRDSMDNGLCSYECEGYLQAPEPGHLWPGELKRMDEDESC